MVGRGPGETELFVSAGPAPKVFVSAGLAPKILDAPKECSSGRALRGKRETPRSHSPVSRASLVLRADDRVASRGVVVELGGRRAGRTPWSRRSSTEGRDPTAKPAAAPQRASDAAPARAHRADEWPRSLTVDLGCQSRLPSESFPVPVPDIHSRACTVFATLLNIRAMLKRMGTGTGTERDLHRDGLQKPRLA